MEWCKLWAEWGTDPKVQSMSESMRCRHALLFCLRCTHDTAKLTEDEIAFYMRITHEELLATKELFMKKGFIDKHWNVTKWDKRQSYVSPAARRMRALRERERNELRNCDVTSCATDVRDVAQLAGAEEEERRKEERREEPPIVPRERGTSPDGDPLLSTPSSEKKTRKRMPEPLPSLPDWTPLEDWSEWLAVRTKKRAPNTGYALRLAIKRLTELREEGHDPVKVLQKAIVAGNTSLWPPGSIFSNGKPCAPPVKRSKNLAELEASEARVAAGKARTEETNRLLREACGE